MKRFSNVAISMLALFLLFSLVGCSADAPKELAGKWTLSYVEAMGQKVDVSQMQGVTEIDMYFDFLDSKKVEVYGGIGASETTGTIQYKYENNEVEIEQDGTTIRLMLEQDELKYDVGTGILVFERK